MKIFLIIPLVMLVLVMGAPFSQAQSVPDWVKNTAGWWATDAISETEFVNAIEFLVKNGIIEITSTSSGGSSESVPEWIKNTAGWWATDAISETEFVDAVTFLVNIGIINVEGENKCVNDLLKYFDDKEKIFDACDEHESTINQELIPYDIELKFNSEGFRGDEFSQKKPDDIYRIVMVGGSTMLGAETTYDTTIPGIVQKLFDKQYPDRKVEVINAGVSGGNSHTEYELISNKLVNYEPDLIIMYDGWNDLSRDSATMLSVVAWEKACKVSNENNFDLIIALQPIAGFGNKSLTIQEKINSLTGEDHKGFQLIQSRATYDYMVRELLELEKNYETSDEGICDMHDLRNIFDNVSGPVYWDQGHILQAGNFILAENFFNISMTKIDPNFNSDFEFTELISKYNSESVISYLLNKIDIEKNGFDKTPRDMSKINPGKGNYFQLKNEFEEISDSFVGKDFQKINLTNIIVNDKDLSHANLSGQDLRNIDLSNTIIRGANLSFTNLEGKDLSGMDLRGVDFSNANLKNVNLKDAIIGKPIQYLNEGKKCNDSEFLINMYKEFLCAGTVVEEETIRTKFVNADLTNVKFGISNDNEMQIISFVDFSYADLTNSNLTNVQFYGCNFKNTILNKVQMDNVIFVNCNLDNLESKNFDLSTVWFQNTSLINAKLTNGMIFGVFLANANLTNTDFDRTDIESLIEIDNSNLNCKNHDICKN